MSHDWPKQEQPERFLSCFLYSQIIHVPFFVLAATRFNQQLSFTLSARCKLNLMTGKLTNQNSDLDGH